MNKLFSVLLAVVALLAATFVAVGLHLNRQSDAYVAQTDARAAVRVTGVKAQHRIIVPEINLSGLLVQARNIADVMSQVEGTIRDLRIAQGDRVQEGDILCRLENPLVAIAAARAGAQVKKAEAEYLNAEENLERSEKLRNENVIPESEYAAAVATADTAKAVLEAAWAELDEVEQQRAFQTVAAPMNGEILSVYRKPGSHQPAGTPLFLLADFGVLGFSRQVPGYVAENLLPLDPGEGVYRLFLGAKDGDGGFKNRPATGAPDQDGLALFIVEITPDVGVPSRFRRLACAIDNHAGGAETGLYNKASIRKNSPRRTLAIPRRLLFEDDLEDDRDIVYVQNAQGFLEKRPIITGVFDNAYIEVKQGLQEGEIVIDSYVKDLDEATPISVVHVDGTGEGTP